MARILARAFADNPCYAFLFPRASRRDADLHRFFEGSLRARAGWAETWVAVGEDDAPLGTATVEPPGGSPGTVPEVVFGWVLPTLVGPGPLALQRQFAASAAFALHNRAAAGQAGYAHLYAVAVDPARQGAGVGAALMKEACAAYDAGGGPAVPLVLTTQRSQNLAFYERFGFDRRGEFSIGEGDDAFVSWSMVRPRVV